MRYLRAEFVTRPRAVAGNKPCGVLRVSHQSGHRETRKRTDTAMARRKTRTHPLMRQTRRFRVARRHPGRSGEIRNMRLSARHPPRAGEGKREKSGEPPRPAKEQGLR